MFERGRKKREIFLKKELQLHIQDTSGGGQYEEDNIEANFIPIKHQEYQDKQ